MPLNEIAKGKMIDWLQKMRESVQDDIYDALSDRGNSILALAEIFTEDEEWTKELTASSAMLTYMNFLLRNIDDYNEDKKTELREITIKNIDNSIVSINKNDWLQYHKSIRNMLFDITQLT